jgi:hypothetical protein
MATANSRKNLAFRRAESVVSELTGFASKVLAAPSERKKPPETSDPVWAAVFSRQKTPAGKNRLLGHPKSFFLTQTLV